MFDGVIRQALLIVAIISGLPLVASALSGLLVGILQAATQIQEQAIGYLAKLVTVVVVLTVCGPWFLSELVQFVQELLGGIGALGGEVSA